MPSVLGNDGTAITALFSSSGADATATHNAEINLSVPQPAVNLLAVMTAGAVVGRLLHETKTSPSAILFDHTGGKSGTVAQVAVSNRDEAISFVRGADAVSIAGKGDWGTLIAVDVSSNLALIQAEPVVPDLDQVSIAGKFTVVVNANPPLRAGRATIAGAATLVATPVARKRGTATVAGQATLHVTTKGPSPGAAAITGKATINVNAVKLV